MLTVGHDVSTLHLVPPGQAAFTSVGHCPGLCSEVSLPSEGVHVFAGLPHTHQLGRQVKLRHIRNGAELPTPFQVIYCFKYSVNTERDFFLTYNFLSVEWIIINNEINLTCFTPKFSMAYHVVSVFLSGF